VRVSFDTNAWERIFDSDDHQFAALRTAIGRGLITGFICEAAFRIEAIRKRERNRYFVAPHLGVRFEGIVVRDGLPYIGLSLGPRDESHPGLPAIQLAKLSRALALGVRVMRTQNWLGLPRPLELGDQSIFVTESTKAVRQREKRQVEISGLIDARGLGKAAFDAVGGWSTDCADEAELIRACSEWGDGELAAAHIAYDNDVLCTADFGRSAGKSIFDPANRLWLSVEYGVVFRTPSELLADLVER